MTNNQQDENLGEYWEFLTLAERERLLKLMHFYSLRKLKDLTMGSLLLVSAAKVRKALRDPEYLRFTFPRDSRKNCEKFANRLLKKLSPELLAERRIRKATQQSLKADHGTNTGDVLGRPDPR